MLAACEVGDALTVLEGGPIESAMSVYNVREPWVTKAVLMYYVKTGSMRALELLVRAPEPHARHLLDALQEQLRDPPSRKHALAVLAPLVARRPAWLHRLPDHQITKDLLRAAKHERDLTSLLNALLAVAALLPAAPSLVPLLAPDLIEILLRPLSIPADKPTRAHLSLAQLALFRSLYATHPCSVIDTLKSEPINRLMAFSPLLRSVRLHPDLVLSNKCRETDSSRWAGTEYHDVVADCRELEAVLNPLPLPSIPLPPTSPAPLPKPTVGSGEHASLTAISLRPGTDPWFPLSERSGAESTPHTPLPVEPDDSEPPEAAVEATPENTPAKEMRASFRFPTESTAVRAIGRRSPAESPPPLDGGGRLARVALDRVALDRTLDSPVLFGGAPPPAVQRPRPNRAVVPLNNLHEEEAMSAALARSLLQDPRLLQPKPKPIPSKRPPPPRRSSSVPRRLPTNTSSSVATQTVEVWPAQYEFVIADYFRKLPDDLEVVSEDRRIILKPCDKLDKYLMDLYEGHQIAAVDLPGQLALANAQLLYERWRREAHAERNRRLLGHCRRGRALKLQNQVLTDRIRALTKERDELRARNNRPSSTLVATDREAELEAALAAEKTARVRLEALLYESKQQINQDAAEVQRARGQSFEVARHVEALTRAALTAERRAEQVRRLRKELLILAERESRLATAVKLAQIPIVDEKAVKHAHDRWAAAKAEADAAIARAESATLRTHELETALSSRDALIVELKRNARAAADEHEAREKALKDKYLALAAVTRRTAALQLNSADIAPLTRFSSSSPSTSLTVADCERLHSLLNSELEG